MQHFLVQPSETHPTALRRYVNIPCMSHVDRMKNSENSNNTLIIVHCRLLHYGYITSRSAPQTLTIVQRVDPPMASPHPCSISRKEIERYSHPAMYCRLGVPARYIHPPGEKSYPTLAGCHNRNISMCSELHCAMQHNDHSPNISHQYTFRPYTPLPLSLCGFHTRKVLRSGRRAHDIITHESTLQLLYL